jgi:hypothetical protein
MATMRGPGENSTAGSFATALGVGVIALTIPKSPETLATNTAASKPERTTLWIIARSPLE